MRRILAASVLAVLVAGWLAADANDAVKAELARERRRLTTDSRTLADVSRRLETALSNLAAASRAVAEAAARADSPAEEISRREDVVSESEQEVRSLLERRRLVADRIVERRRSIAALEAELTTRKPQDSVTGRWAVTLDPGSQRGVFHMNLDGTIVSGDYTLDGGYTGSLRGTLVNDRLRLERVDSRLGFSAIFYGRVARDLTSIAGTWETTTFGSGESTNGVWKAIREDEKEENP